jgi:hypothetical protein
MNTSKERCAFNLENFDAVVDQRWSLPGGLVCSSFVLRISFTASIFHNLKNTNAALPHFFSIWKNEYCIVKIIS